MMWATTAIRFLKGLPWQLYAGIGAVLLLGLAYCAGDRAGYERRDAEQAVLDRKAAEKAREADQSARDATDETKEQVEQDNDRARDAASSSDDPLGAGLDSLRETQAGSDTSTR